VAGAAIGPNALQQSLPTYTAANATEIAQRPAGLADLIEKVKPAVISVRVKVEAGSEMMSSDDMPVPQNSPRQRFFHHFGMPNDEDMPDRQHQPRGQFVSAEGSAFFITADGYAVTNNHVVDKAKAVEIKTDDARLMMPR
jgi:serine protease Do